MSAASVTARTGPMFRPAIAVLVLATVGAVVEHGVARAEQAVRGIALVKVGASKTGPMPDMVYGYGAISPSAGSSSTLNSQRDGFVAKFHVQARDPVKKGDKLIDYETAREVVTAYQQAGAILRLAQSTKASTAQLYAQQLATRRDLDNAEQAVLDAQAIHSRQVLKGGATPTETLSAPFDGVVTAILVSPGARLEAGTALLTLMRTDGD
jgi:multidrug efflux pump subunit AcrA (membrane-fusion protein)